MSKLELLARTSEVERVGGFIFASTAMRGLVRELKHFGKQPLLITGESGVGKEVVARLAHQLSARRKGPFVALNCAALPLSLAESELFGHVRGAFTGATHDREGVFVRADGGTLFLDEIGELALDLQAKLLRVLEMMAVRPVGGRSERRVDVRLVSATNRDLDQMVEVGRFRADLLYRIDVHSADVPPLRERPEDVAALTQHLLAAQGFGDGIRHSAMQVLESYSWPGNVRELRNVLVRAVALTAGCGALEARHIQGALHRRRRRSSRAPRVLRHDAYRFASQVLAENQGNRQETYRQLGVSKSTFYRWLRAGHVRDFPRIPNALSDVSIREEEERR